MLHSSHDTQSPAPRAIGASRRPISDAIARSIIDNTDIVAVVGEVVDLRKKGDEYIGLCPFHNDNHPSMSVNGEKGIYSCWSCEAGGAGSRAGDAVTFVRRYFNIGYREALEYLAPRAGVSLGYELNSAHIKPTPRKAVEKSNEVDPNRPDPNAPRAPILAALSNAEGFFADALFHSEDGMAYLAQRGFDPAALPGYSLGFASASPFDLQNKLAKLHGQKVLLDAGLVRARTSKAGKRYAQDFFLNRLTFAIRNEAGETIAFGARRLGAANAGSKAPKYINSPDTAVFTKSEELFGLYESKEDIKRRGYAIVVEGYFDVLALAARGVKNVVAPMGTSLTEHQIKKLLLHAKRLVLCLDGDAAGQQAMLRSLKTILPQIDSPDRLAFLMLPDGLDPDEIMRKETGAQFFARVAHAKSLAGFIAVTFEGFMKDPAVGVKGTIEHMEILLKASEHLTQFHEMFARFGAKLVASQAPAALRAPATVAINGPLARLALAASRHPTAGESALQKLTVWARDSRLDADVGVRNFLSQLRAVVASATPVDPDTQTPAAKFASSREAELLARAVDIANEAFFHESRNNGHFPRRPDFLRNQSVS